MITVLICAGCFFVGMIVGVVLDDAWILLRSSRKDRPMWKPRASPLQVLVASLLVAVMANIGLGFHLAATRASDRENAVVTCENTNESRAAQLTLWTYVLELSRAQRDEPLTAEETRAMNLFEAWIAVLFRARDCSDQSRRYELPPPPPIPPR